MMATIEPRLIHLLNESTTPQLPHNDLPPIHTLPLPKAGERSLPPLESDAVHRSDRSGRDGHGGSNAGAPVYGYATGDGNNADSNKDVVRTEGVYAGSTASVPLRLLLGESGVTEHFPGPNHIPDDGLEILDDAGNKKRHRGLLIKDDFMQLPQPLKKQKAAQQGPVMPPIINGLHEPPPHAAMFPPISSNSFDEDDVTQLNLRHDLTHLSEEQTLPQPLSEAEQNASKARKRATKPRRKWSEEETNHLLLGVSRHGVGKWTCILEDKNFKFNDRTAGDLKDRFRTCCPDELRQSTRAAPEPCPAPPQESQKKTKTRTHLDKILIENEELPATEKDDDAAAELPKEGESSKKPRKSRAHRKKMQDLAELGIHAPFKKSHRRERRPFTDKEDQEILLGLERYGPAWTKIQRDARFTLSSRQPTDLRDRVRNKYSEVYHRIEKGTFQIKDAGRGSDLMEPSINMSIENSLQPSKTPVAETQINRTASREDLPRWPLQLLDMRENSQSGASFDFGEGSGPHFTGGEMDISRLLLDDPKNPQTRTKRAAEGVSEPSSPARPAPEPQRDHAENHGTIPERAQLPGRSEMKQ